MGLNMVVGVLADCADEEEYAEEVRADLARAGELLQRSGAGAWREPELAEDEVAWYEMGGYGGLHTLRRVAVHLAAHGRLPDPLDGSMRASEDPLLTLAYAEPPGDPAGPFDHLVQHSDCDGFYIPVEFDQVIEDEELTGGYLGSSVRLLAELRRVAAALELPEDLDPEEAEAAEPGDALWQRYPAESFRCLQLIRAAKHSIATGAAIIFC